MGESKKREALEKLFKKLLEEKLEESKENNNNFNILFFNNDDLNEIANCIGVKNKFDIVKVDSSQLLPEILREKQFFIIHLGKGKHAFVSFSNCNFSGYVNFPDVLSKDKFYYKLKPTLLSKISKSESQMISDLYNLGIFSDFIFGSKSNKLLMSCSRRAKIPKFSFYICQKKFKIENLQVEIDAILETTEADIKDRTIYIVEAKRSANEDFEVRQIFSNYLYFEYLKNERILPPNMEIHILIVRLDTSENSNILRVLIYEYKFKNPLHMESIDIVKKKEYQIEFM